MTGTLWIFFFEANALLMECLSPRIACLLLHPILLQCPIYYNRWHETKQMAGVAIFVKKSILHLDN